ncbi:high-affinity branched-chain amino acid transport ATP-binding protein LivF [Variibacter gotjawalensis]|uniref:High-affinity branched-chain amino acid transport ATP-binding protein LivF n=1 Tax=Variibacter gotjawalensis TaxID=1333996 RepID=A0A0S3PPS6_9BRAD|nr:ABC transporter ATP-binding protein [Variibacter gotjawalensis]NIK48241.1 branched-chain amino acid transport system ATP-binding protein [Variibacter gotjawalensis]RZS50113.1 amino acid/amide ABC transporter ATP-binding protein 2 (HAAT family) [Variibacter gotjawalensis]BAT57943.1 high-affinity branched-chain amino acid transport ATP-binding protein LivF [Variibacter gotjawalensis]
MSDALLTIANLNTWYGAAQIIYDLSLNVQRGEVVALMGRNGAGKSTTMRSAMGMIAKKTGSVQFIGQDISHAKPYEIARLGLGFTPEDRRVFSDLTVLENLDIGRQPPRRFPNGKDAPLWTEERLFKLFPNLGEMPDRPGGAMSGGEQQMLAVARTLMGNPLMILLDEPSEGVAPLIVEQMANTILELKQQGLSILLSEQNIHFAQLVSDRAYLLEKGQLRWEGSMAELTTNTELQRTYLTV